MSLFLIKRFITFVATLFGATILTFLALEILPEALGLQLEE